MEFKGCGRWIQPRKVNFGAAARDSGAIRGAYCKMVAVYAWSCLLSMPYDVHSQLRSYHPATLEPIDAVERRLSKWILCRFSNVCRRYRTP